MRETVMTKVSLHALALIPQPFHFRFGSKERRIFADAGDARHLRSRDGKLYRKFYECIGQVVPALTEYWQCGHLSDCLLYCRGCASLPNRSDDRLRELTKTQVRTYATPAWVSAEWSCDAQLSQIK